MTRRKEPPSDAVAEPALPDQADPVISAPPFVEELPPENVPDSVMVDARPPEPTPEPQPLPRRAGIFAPLLGGALAATAGFALSHFNVLGFAAPDASADLARLGTRIDELATLQTEATNKISADLPQPVLA